MFTRDPEVWASAVWVEERFGSAGLDFIRERIRALMRSDDIRGVERWGRVEEAYGRLTSETPTLRH